MSPAPSPHRFTPIVGSLAYLWDRQADAVLMVRRNARADDDQFGKVNGLGGKLEPDEDIVENVRRELREEADIEITEMKLRGTITWTQFGPKNEDWLGFIFLVTGWTGTIPERNEEGPLEWIPRERLLLACADNPAERQRADLPMWEGDRFFVPLVFDQDPLAFHGTMPYRDDQPASWSFQRL